MIHRNTKIFILFTLILLMLQTASWASAIVLRSNITGVTGPILKNVEERLAIAQASYGLELSPATINLFYKNAPLNIQKAIEPFGYFHSQVQPELTHIGEIWTARFVIHLGPPIHITSTDIQITGPGKDNSALQAILADYPVKPGHIFEAEIYDKAKQNLFQTANDEGYLKANFEHKVIRIDLKKNTVVVILHLDTGPRFYFGRVTFNQETFSDKFLERFLSFREGEPFSSPKLIKFQQNLSNSNYFQSVNVNPDLQNTEQLNVPINVALKANKAKQYNLGLGYGTFTGPRLTLGANLRHLTNTGHHFDMQLKLSQVLSGLALQYVIPGENPLTDQYTIGANVQKFSPKNGNSISKSISFGYVKTVNEWKWMPTISYLREHYNITGNPSHNSRILYPSFEVSRIKADDLINTR
jgi:translocation and assembly module TamA